MEVLRRFAVRRGKTERRRRLTAVKKQGRRRRERHPAEKAHWLSRSDVRVTPAGSWLSAVNMAAVDVIVDNLVTFWRKPAARQNFHWIFLLITSAGSILKELELVPQTYFSHSRNALNV